MDRDDWIEIQGVHIHGVSHRGYWLSLHADPAGAAWIARADCDNEWTLADIGRNVSARMRRATAERLTWV